MICKYKYVLAMPTMQCEIEDLVPKHVLPKYDDITSGKDMLFVSPVYFDQGANRPNYQLFFDVDFKKTTFALGIKTSQTISKMLDDINIKHFFEASPNGLHIFSKEMYILDATFSTIKEKYFKKFGQIMPGLDVTSSLRDLPVHRMGSYRNTFTVLPCESINTAIMKKEKKPNKIYPYIEWERLFYEYLVPTQSQAFVTQIMRNLSALCD